MFSSVRTSVYPLTLSFLLSFAVATYAAEPRSYPLLCKGGGSNTLNFPPPQQYFDDLSGTAVGFSFRKSSGPATAGLQPGTCAWMDRPLNSNEPAALFAKFPDAFVYISVVTSSNGQTSNRYRYSGDQPHKRNLEAFVSAILTGKEFQVYAYYDGGTDLVVTKFGP